jgi:hypothetical protein
VTATAHMLARLRYHLGRYTPRPLTYQLGVLTRVGFRDP